jgi:hypothetical protein
VILRKKRASMIKRSILGKESNGESKGGKRESEERKKVIA